MKKIVIVLVILLLAVGGYYFGKSLRARNAVAQIMPLPDTDFIVKEKQAVGGNYYFITKDAVKFDTYIFKVSADDYAKGAVELRYNKANMQGWSHVSKVQ